MRPVGCLAFLLSAAFIVCSSDLFYTEQARATAIQTSIPEKSFEASDPQFRISREPKTEAQGQVASRPISPPGNGSIYEVPNVLADADFTKSAGRVKESTKETDLLDQFKSISEVIKNGVEVIAIIIGGFWTYTLFVSQRQKYPRANLTHRITHRSLGNGKLLLNVDATLSNAGGVLIRIVSGELRIQHVLPLSSTIAIVTADSASSFPKLAREFSWDVSSHPLEWATKPSEIEPGEENQFHYDCILPDATEVIKVYSYYKNEVKSGRNVGWNLTTVYDLTTNETTGRKEGSMTHATQPRPPQPVPWPTPGPEPLQEGPKPKPGG